MPPGTPRPGPRRRLWAAGAILILLVAAGAVWLWLGGRAGPGPPSRDPPRSGAGAEPRRPAQIRLISVPIGAEIIVDGQPTGRYAPDLFEVESGRPHRLRLELEGYEPFVDQLTLEPGEVREIRVELVPMPP